MFRTNKWFKNPEAELVDIKACSKSGYRAGPDCKNVKTETVNKAGMNGKGCPYCQIVHCDSSLSFRVHSGCERVADIRKVKWFVLPPAMEWYYRKNHSDYYTLPPFREDCSEVMREGDKLSMTLIYPDKTGRIYIPLELDGLRGKVVFEAAHRFPDSTIYWHLDD